MGWTWGTEANERSQAGSERFDAAPRPAQAGGKLPVFNLGRRRWRGVEIGGDRFQRRRFDQRDRWARGAYLRLKHRIELFAHPPDGTQVEKGIVAHKVDGIGDRKSGVSGTGVSLRVD